MCSKRTANDINFQVNSALKEIATNEGISDYLVELSPASSKTNGCTATLFNVKIVGKTKDLSTKTLNFILKRLSTSEAYRKKFPIEEMFHVELHMYSNVLPMYEFLQHKHGLSLLHHPRFYKGIGDHNHEAIIMEDMKNSGFQLYKDIAFNNEHLYSAIAECGRLHAVSFAFKIKEPKKFEEIAPRNHLGLEIYEKYLRKSTTNLSGKSLSLLDPITDMEAIAKFGAYVKNLDMFFKSLREYSDDKYCIIVHGDFWSNNLMFKYEDDEKPMKPTQVCIFDFQTSTFGPPAMDLATLIYTNCLWGNYDQIDEYLKFYYKTLSNHLDKFNCDCSTMYPFEVLKKQWKASAKFAFTIAQMVAYILSCEEEKDKDDIMDLEKIAESNMEFEAALSGNLCNNLTYGSMIKPLILHLVKNNLL